MFRTWGNIKRHFEVMKSACSLQQDPSVLVELVCHRYVEFATKNLRKRYWYGNSEDLSQLAQQLKGSSIDPLCNSKFYLVTELPLKRRSRMYVFNVRGKPISDKKSGIEIQADRSSAERCTSKRRAEIGGNIKARSETGSKVKEVCTSSRAATDGDTCVVCVERCNAADQDVLKTISNLDQPITDFFANRFQIEHDDLPVDCYNKRNQPFSLDLNFRSIRLRFTKLPETIQESIGRQLVSAGNLEILEIPENPLIANHILSSLHKKPHLKVLGFNNCGLSEEQCISICEQLEFLPELTYISLAKNKISPKAMKSLTESLSHWESRPLLLHVYECDIDTSSCTELLNALTRCQGLQKLDVSGNPIGGAFAALDPHVMYSSLMELEMRSTPLTGSDVQALGAIMGSNGMPQLWKLQLGYNSPRYPRKLTFTRDAVVEALKGEPTETWEALGVILDKVKDVELWDGTSSTHRIEMKKVEKELARRLQVTLGKVK